MSRSTKVIVVANQKGGVGKTTNSIHIAAGFAELGRKCLIIDLDASAGATKTLGAPLAGWNTVYELLTGEVEPADAIISDTDPEVRLPKNIHLIPSSSKLNEIDSFLTSIDNLGVVPQDLLLEPIRQVRGEYDYILLDSPPLVTRTTYPSYKTADYAVFTTQLEKLSTDALEAAMKLVASVKRHGNSRLVLLGVVISMAPQPMTRLARHYLNLIDQVVRDEQGRSLRFESRIPRNVAIQEAGSARQTLFEYAPDHKAVAQYRLLVKEIEARIQLIEEQVASEQGVVANG